MANHQRFAYMLRHFYYPFLVYRSFFFPFLVASAIAIPCWLIVRSLHVRRVGHPMSFRRELLLLTFVVYLAGVSSATLTPNHPSRANEWSGGLQLRPSLASLTCSSATMSADSKARFFCRHNAVGNILLFIPFGVLLPLVWRQIRFWRAMQIAIAVSFCIELVQFLAGEWMHRMADVNDVILNSIGAFVGLALVYLMRKRHIASRHSAV